MSHGSVRVRWLFVLFAIVACAAGPAYGQGGSTTTTLSGTVVDTSGGVIPGADVTIKNVATGTTFSTVTGGNGEFSIPSIPPATYQVTVSLMGFKTVVLSEVTLAAAVPGSIRPVLEVGALEETVVVEAGAEIVPTTSSTVATTLTVNQITNLPLQTRSALDFIANLPGVDTASTVRDSHVMGLPQSAINITLDGMNIQDNFMKSSDGFFTRVSARMDAVEQMTFTSAAQGADSAGQGAVQIRFTTRSGTNKLIGSSYYSVRHDALNSNSWFNIRDNQPKPKMVLHQPGTRAGGPIYIPGLFDGRNKAFFFVNYEESRSPSTPTDSWDVLHPRALDGFFRYKVGDEIREVNLFELAAKNGQISTPDPTVMGLLQQIRAATLTTGNLGELPDPAVQEYKWQTQSKGLTRYPTVRLDFNLTDAHRLSFSTNITDLFSNPDRTNTRQQRFPGFPHIGVQDSFRYSWTGSVRSTLGRTLVNELSFGGSGGATLFNPNWTTDMYSNQGGYHLTISAADIDNASSGTAVSSREASTKMIEDQLSWIKGSHSFKFGGNFTRVDLWLQNQQLVPSISFGVVSGDPAESLFSSGNFPGSSSADRTNARNLYAVLTGRVSQISREARINEAGEFVPLGTSRAEGRMHNMGFWAQDSWKARKDLTINLGLRYELQLPFYALNNSYSMATIEDVWGVTGVAPDFVPGALVNNIGYLYQPGVLKGKKPEFHQFDKGTHAYNIDWDNVGPSIGANWTPYAEKGFLRKFLGQPGDTAIRGGYTVAFQRNGMSDFSDIFGANPGVYINLNRSLSLGNLGNVPNLLRNDDTAIPAYEKTRTYPMTDVVTGDINTFDPNLQVPYAKTYTIGWSRALTRQMAMEVRYIGTRNYDGWNTYNYNEVNIIENGFLDEFKMAQANLQANIAAGRGANFKYYGPGTGTSPLPIYLAYLTGKTAKDDPGAYTGTLWANSSFVDPLAKYNPNPFTAAGLLDDDAARRKNALDAGLPANFLVINPDLLGGANIVSNAGYTRYNGLQLELNRRLSQGLQFQASYTYGKAWGSSRYSFRRDRLPTRQTGGEGGITHAVKFNWVYELPFGQGRRFLSGLGRTADTLVGGWNFAGLARIQSGRMLDFGNVRLVGFTEKDLEKMFKLQFRDKTQPDGSVLSQMVYMLPQDIIDETVKAYSVSATSPTGYGEMGPPSGRYFAPANSDPACMETVANGYGDCGNRSVVVTGPMFVNFDMSVSKRFPITERVNFEFRAEVFNVFNKANFTPTVYTGTALNSYLVSGLTGVTRQTQLSFRLNW